MTTEEKARAYDEALEDMRVIYPNLRGDAKLAVEHAFPGLVESEDERVREIITDSVFYLYGAGDEYKDTLDYLDKLEKRKECLADNGKSASEDERIRRQMIRYFTEMKKGGSASLPYDDCIAYLERQKEDDRYEAIPVESTLEYKLGFKAGRDSERREEQKPNFDTHWENGSMVCEQKEQKPIECIDFYDEFYKVYTGPKNILAYVNIFVKKLGYVPIDIHELSACVHYVIKHIEEDTKAKQKEQKPAEWSEPLWAELQSEFKNINEAFEDGKKEVVAHPERYGLCECVPAEWDEEDRDTLLMAATVLKANFDSDEKFEDCDYDCGTLAGKLLGMRYRISPSWKPSEEELRTLDIVISDYRHACTKGSDKKAEILKPLLEQLRKL